METRISSKGQITLPVEARRQLNIKAGDALKVKVVGENSLILEVTGRAAGVMAADATGKDIIAATAGLWQGRTDIDEGYFRRMRQADRNRLEKLLNE